MAEVSRDHFFTVSRLYVEVSEGGADYVGWFSRSVTSDTGGGKRRSFHELTVKIRVDAGDDIERHTAGSENERVEGQAPPGRDPCAAKSKAVTDVSRGASVFAVQVVRVKWEISCALSVSIIVRITQSVVTEKCK